MPIELPRRKFLSGLGLVLAAPAIVRASSLMPVRSWIEPELLVEGGVTGNNQLLTIDLITREALRLWKIAAKQRNIKMTALEQNRTLPATLAGPKLEQKSSDWEFTSADRTLPLDQFSRRVLVPAIGNLALSLPEGSRIQMADLALPKGVAEAAHIRDGAAALRMLSDYFIGTDSVISRIDIRYEKG